MIETENVINKFVKESQEILKDNLTGIYLHGSAVMGCFNPEKSDLDLIVVVNEPLQDDVKRILQLLVKEESACGANLSKGFLLRCLRRITWIQYEKILPMPGKIFWIIRCILR